MSKDIDQLTVLNRDYVNSVQNSDVKRFDEILAEDFYCTNPDKSLVNRAGFLKQTAVPVTIKNLEAHDVRISRDGRFCDHPCRYQLYDAGWEARFRPLHRLLVTAKRPLACGFSACFAVKDFSTCVVPANAGTHTPWLLHGATLVDALPWLRSAVADGVDGPLRHRVCQNEVVRNSFLGAVREPDYPNWNGYVEAYFSAAWG